VWGFSAALSLFYSVVKESSGAGIVPAGFAFPETQKEPDGGFRRSDSTNFTIANFRGESSPVAQLIFAYLSRSCADLWHVRAIDTTIPESGIPSLEWICL
jgi:hypothetical protein